ncbi:MAG: peptide chain release factor N(5)-glutamine methyltransferase [Bacteroidales bacterium]|nr:peptide chain release factor N(5)-glutamine methyltransferase [Bacteroidales bacterium]
MLQNCATLKQIRFYLLEELRQIYDENESDSIARLILEHVGYQLSETLLDPDHRPALPVYEQINAFVTEIHTGKPIQYILGESYFCDLKIKVNEDVLIPRPETEELVDIIKKQIQNPVQRIIDLGTGSGCMALALKQHFREAEVWGVDISKRALSVARENGRSNQLLIHWQAMDLLSGKPEAPVEAFDLVVSNPPYVLNSEREVMARRVKDFEPGTALFVPDEDPLIYYRAIALFCQSRLADSGDLWVEINEQLGHKTAGLFLKEGFRNVVIHKDIHKKERYIHARR